MTPEASRARCPGGSSVPRSAPRPARESRGWKAGSLAFLVLATAIALPTCLGVLAVDITAELTMTDADLGLVVSGFWAVTALAAPVAGRWIDRAGWPIGARLGSVVVAACLAACALFVDSWPALLLVVAVSGIGYGLCSPTSNLLVMALVPPARHASMLGMKQTAPPLLMAAAGATLPGLAHLLDWRAAMAIVGALPMAVLLLIGTRSYRPGSNGVPRDRPAPAARRAERRALAPLVIASGLGTFSVATITGFAVLTLVSAGLSPVVAAGVVSGGSLLAVLIRVAGGRYLDARPAADVKPLLVMMLLASVTLTLVAAGVVGLDAADGAGVFWRVMVVVGVVLALVAAWTWPALLLITVVRSVSAPGSASGTIQLGSGLGSAVGPSVFGVLSDAGGRGWAWAAMAVATVAAMALVRFARSLAEG